MAKIPTILEPGRADGKLVTSGAIFDENKSMFQSELNDVQDTLSSDNPNKPLSAKQGKVLKELLDTKVIEAGAVPIDTNPIEGNITHVVSSDGLAKEFNKCSTEIIQGGVYDVSAHNNSKVFESLYSLLNNSNLDTLIPISVRHGGMSIRFIQSSDNKYVQFMLTNQNWSIDVNDWTSGESEFVTGEKVSKIGIDDEPTAESNNLIKSGGVYTSLKRLKSELGTKVDELDSVLNGTVASNITHSFNSDYEYWQLPAVIASGTQIKNNSQYQLTIYTTNDVSGEVKTIEPNGIYTPNVDILWLRCTQRGDYSLSVGVTIKGLVDRFEESIEELNANDVTQNADLEVLKKDMYEVVYNKSLGTWEFYGSETEPLSHIIHKGAVIKNNSTNYIRFYNSDKSIEIPMNPQQIITTDFDVYFLRNGEVPQTIDVSVASALESSLFRENAIKKLVLGYRIDLNLSGFQYYPAEGRPSDILINKDVNVKNNGTYAVTLHDVHNSQSVEIGPGKRVRVPFDVYYIRNYSEQTADVSLEIEGLPSVEERVKVLEEKPSSSIDSVVVNVSDSVGIPSGSALLDNGVLTLQLDNIKGEQGIQGLVGPKGDKGDKGEKGNDGAPGIQGNSGVASSDGIESIHDLSQVIPNDTIERVYVAGAKVVKDKIEHLYRDKAPYSQFYGNENTAKNINGGSGKSVIIGDDNGMYATNDANCNTLVGYHADYGLTTGHSNTAIGCEALDRNRSGHDNVAVGMFAVGCNNLNAEDPTTYKSCTYNVGVGAYALHHNGGISNTAVGNFSSQSLDDEDTDNSNFNTAVGNYSLAYNKQGSYNVCIGNAAGKYSQGSLELYIDAIDRGDDSRNNPENITKGRTKSLVYGKFDGSPSSQEFHINAGLIIMPYLPSSDPHVSGALWNDSGILKISNG